MDERWSLAFALAFGFDAFDSRECAHAEQLTHCGVFGDDEFTLGGFVFPSDDFALFVFDWYPVVVVKPLVDLTVCADGLRRQSGLQCRKPASFWLRAVHLLVELRP
jgi:hypothetical protein